MAKLPLTLYLDYMGNPTFRNPNHPNSNIQSCSRKDVPIIQQFFIQVNHCFFGLSNCFASAVSRFLELPAESWRWALSSAVAPGALSILCISSLPWFTHWCFGRHLIWLKWFLCVKCRFGTLGNVFAGRSEISPLNRKQFPEEGLKWNKKEGNKINILRGHFLAHHLNPPPQYRGWAKVNPTVYKILYHPHSLNIHISRRNSSDWV